MNVPFQEDEITKRKGEISSLALLEAEVKQFNRENNDLRQYVLALQGEVYGARLAARYLDKELAGRSVNLCFRVKFSHSPCVFVKITGKTCFLTKFQLCNVSTVLISSVS